MGSFGALASRYYTNVRSLEEFDEALEFLRERARDADKEIATRELQKVLVVLKPIKETLSRNLSDSLMIDDFDVVDILRQRHMPDWQAYQDRMTKLVRKLAAADTAISQEEREILNDVADALDTQCTRLFKRMSGRS